MKREVSLIENVNNVNEAVSSSMNTKQKKI